MNASNGLHKLWREEIDNSKLPEVIKGVVFSAKNY